MFGCSGSWRLLLAPFGILKAADTRHTAEAGGDGLVIAATRDIVADCSEVLTEDRNRDPFEDIDDSVLLQIFLCIINDQPEQLLYLKAVSRRWSQLANEAAPLMFQQRFQLGRVTGEPRSQRFFTASSASSFVYEHQCNHLSTLSEIAVRYGTDVHSIKRANNLISESALSSRQRIFVPVSDISRVEGRAVTLKWCPVVRREYAALDSSEDATPYSEIIVEGSTLNDPTRARKLLKMLSTGLRIDESQANFYLVTAGGNMKEAIRLQKEDAAWERSQN